MLNQQRHAKVQASRVADGANDDSNARTSVWRGAHDSPPASHVRSVWLLALAVAALVSMVMPTASAAAAALPKKYVAPGGSASVLLTTGKYLVVGGCAPGHCPSVVTDAVLYDLATGTATRTGSTLTPHAFATLTLLRSGRVLLAGGCSGRLCYTINPTAEVWDPATGKWTATSSMLADKAVGLTPEYASAVLLNSGQVLVAGGINYSAVAQIWDPKTGGWLRTGPMTARRESFTLTLLRSGEALAAGGCDYYYCQTVLGSAELYNPGTNSWNATGKMIQPRYDHSAALLSTGQVRVTGGLTPAQTNATITELYDPTTGTWSKTK